MKAYPLQDGQNTLSAVIMFHGHRKDGKFYFLPWGYNLRWCIITLITFNDNTAAVYASHEGCEGNAIVGLGEFCCCVCTSIGGTESGRE